MTGYCQIDKDCEEKDLQIAKLMNKLEQLNPIGSTHGPSHPLGFTP